MAAHLLSSTLKDADIRFSVFLLRVRSGARAVQLTPCTKASVEKIKEAEESKEKTYSALCWAERCVWSFELHLLPA